MDKLRDNLLALFALKKGKVESANRKSLDRFLQRTEFQKRRQAFFEAACGYGKKKSRVAMCKKGKRPGFATELRTQTTKQLRGTILEFLKELGILDVPKVMKKNKTQLAALARKNHWEAVLFLSDTSIDKPEEKKGGMLAQGYASNPEIGSDDEPEDLDWMRRLGPAQKKALAERRKGYQDFTRKRRASIYPRRPQSEAGLRLREPARRRRRGPVKGSKYKKKAHVIRGRDPDGDIVTSTDGSGSERALPVGELVNDPVETIPPREEMIGIRRPAVVGRIVPYDPEPIVQVSDNPPRQRVLPGLRTQQKQRGAVVPRTRERTAVVPKIIPKITQPVQTEEDEPRIPPREDEKDSQQPEADIEESFDERRDCFTMSDEEDACECVPDSLTTVRLSKAQRKELNRINALRKLNCAKLNLLKCTLDLKKYQTRVWEADRLNTNGDFLASFGKNPAGKLNKIKQVTAPEDRDFLKAVLANQNATLRLKKGKEHLARRLANKKGKLGKDYTLASMRHDQVLDEKAWSNDVFTVKALENRDKEAPLAGKITCDTFKVPKCPPRLPCPEKTKEKPFANLTQLPKVVPQKQELQQPSQDEPREPPIQRGDPGRRGEPLGAVQRDGLPYIPEFAQRYPSHRDPEQYSEAEERSVLQEHARERQELDPAVPENLAKLEHLVHAGLQTQREQPPLLSNAPTEVFSEASSAVPDLPQQQAPSLIAGVPLARSERELAADIQRHQDVTERIAQGSGSERLGSSEPTTESSRETPGTPKSFRKGPGPPDVGGGSNDPAIVRYSTAIAQPSTPVFGSQKPGELRKMLDREPMEMGSDITLKIPEPGSPTQQQKITSLQTGMAGLEKKHEKSLESSRVATPKTPSGAKPMWQEIVRRVSPEKQPQLLGKRDVPLVTERVDILPEMPPLSLTGGTKEEYKRAIELSLDHTVMELQVSENDFRSRYQQHLVHLRWPQPRADLPKVPKILDAFPWRTVKYYKKVSLGLAQRIYDAIEPLVKQVDFIQISEPVSENSVTTQQIEWAQKSFGLLRTMPYRLTVEKFLNILQIIAPRKIVTKQIEMLNSREQIETLQLRKTELGEKLVGLEAEAHEAQQKRAPSKPKKKPAGSGFRSRVGALLRKRKGRKKSNRKPRKPRKAKKKPKTLEVQKEKVILPKKAVEIPRSPKIKKEKTAGAIHKFPDVVRKRRGKKYLH